MLLTNKVVVVYGAGGAVGSVVARAFAGEGARVFATGRRLEPVARVVNDIVRAGGVAEAAQLNALDESGVARHLDAVIASTGRVDVSFNAIGIPQQGIQGIPLTDLSVESFALPVSTYATSQFITARAAARRMAAQRSGVILMHTPEPARLGAPLVGGMGPAWAAMEGLSRGFSAELAAAGVRAVVLRTTGLPETATIDVVFDLHAKAAGTTRQQFQSIVEGMTHRRQSTTLAELASVAAFVASDRASAMTGTVANLTGGAIVD
ncbi:MAG TPA: SDR family oxidoreductase [Vicinamibacterales bacterium]|nr:SDR family oxidoreductase [Vicinamibacterales bacterium]